MFEFDLDNVQLADIKVVGCGGGGSNAGEPHDCR